MSVLDVDIDESRDDLLLDSDSEVPDDDDDGEAENTWKDDAQKHDRYTFSEPFGVNPEMPRCPSDNLRNYWSLKPRNLPRNGHSIAGDFMTRDRFEEIQRHLHFVDNAAADKTNKLYKLRPIPDYLNNRFPAMYRPEKELCFDESVVPFRG
ncbi:hypothetical protein RB195_018528 [Necator americanus]|uniref:PiggyBac transposable element-derived protein domain-containing protein n=1 Tax=Necator americanus TaxID=51031 RepID=A0ABR1CCD0_NECAM